MADEQQKRDFVLNTSISEPPLRSGRHDTNVVDNDDEYFKSLPPGYRFKPFDEELIVHYLNNKIHNKPLPRNKIKEVDLYEHNPETLAARYPPYGEKEWYFFTHRDRKYPNGERPKRDAGDGYWKATGADKKIFNDQSSQMEIGYRKALVFYEGKPPFGLKTDWIMHEYRASGAPQPKHKGTMRLDDVVLCRLYKKVDNKSGRNKQKDVPTEQDDQDEQLSENENGNHQTEMVDFSRELPYEEGPSNMQLLQPKPEHPFSQGPNYNAYLGSNLMTPSNFRNSLNAFALSSSYSAPDFVNGTIHSFTNLDKVLAGTGHHGNGTDINEDISLIYTPNESRVMHNPLDDVRSRGREDDEFSQNLSSFVPHSEHKYSMMVNGNHQHGFPETYTVRTMPFPALPHNVLVPAPTQYGLPKDSKGGQRDFKK